MQDTMHHAYSLSYHETNVMTVEECKQRLAKARYMDPDESFICTSSPRGKTICLHDSGSPLSLDGSLVGIASANFNCDNRYPDLFTNVFPYVQWLREIANQLE